MLQEVHERTVELFLGQISVVVLSFCSQILTHSVEEIRPNMYILIGIYYYFRDGRKLL